MVTSPTRTVSSAPRGSPRDSSARGPRSRVPTNGPAHAAVIRDNGCAMRAQTNIQLYRQLLAARHAVAQVQQVRDAYALAARLFAAQLRPEGRRFVCHLVGAASLLAQQETAFPIVLAGPLHSAYPHGAFGGGPG